MSSRSPGPRRRTRAVAGARRVWPYLVMAWERWQALPAERREEYLKRARDTAGRARAAVEKRRRGRG